MPRPRFLLLALVLAATGGAASAQVPVPSPRVQLQDEAPSQSYALAATLLANGRVEEATALLEDLYAANPADVAVLIKLEEAYVAGRRFDDLVGLVDRRIVREGRTAELLASRGTALARADRPDEADRAWTEALAIDPDDPQTVRSVVNALGELRLFDRAADVLAEGRERLGDAISALELAHVYGLALDYPRAVDLYLEALADDPALRPTVQTRLTRLVAGQGAPEAFAAAFQRAATLDPLDRGVRELQAWLALEQGQYDVALDAVRALDRLEREQGQSLVAFADQANAAGATDVAARALDEVLERHPDGPVAPIARLARARLWDAQARADRERADLGPTPAADAARDAYAAVLDADPADPRRPAVALALADLLRDVYRAYDDAERWLGEAAAGRDVGVTSQARLTLGEVALRRGDLDAARQRFADVDEAVRIGPLAEQARYELALIDFYEGFMYSALARAEALDENTAADAANDAIALRVTLNDALDPEAMPGPDVDLTGDPLHVYGRAALRHRRGLYGEALATLDSLDATAGLAHALADESLYLRASVQLADGAPEASVATLDQLLDRHPDSFFVDRALRSQAETYETQLDDPTAAAERYDRLLERFPGSPLAPEAREVLRRLRAALNS